MKLFEKYKKYFISGALILGISSFLSRFLGLVRDRLFAEQFGAGRDLDAYYAAFRIPDFIFNLLILGALSSAFIPIFVDYLSQKKQKEAWHLANSLLNIILGITIVICAIIFIFAPHLMFLIAPGFSGSEKELTAQLTRIMLLSPIFFGFSNIAGAILTSYKRFFFYALAPIMYNLGIIFGAWFLVDPYGIKGIAYGVVIGAFLHFIVQLPSIYKLGYRYKFIFDYTHKGVQRVVNLMIPSIMGLAMTQINLWVITVIASLISVGSITIFNFASNLQYFPVGVFGISIGLAAFPKLAEAVSLKKSMLFKNTFSFAFSKIMFFVIPISVFMLLMRAQIVRLVLGSGKFDWEDTYLTAQSLGLFTLSLFAQALIPLLVRSFYSMQDAKTPVFISIVSMITNIAGGLILSKYFGVLGLALAFSFAALINMLLLFVVLRYRLGDLGDSEIIKSILKTSFLTIISGIVCYCLLIIMANFVDMETFIGILLQASVAFVGGAGVFILLAWVFKFRELGIVKSN
ncbi:MAG: murein biosynthesis integral membrane protein MurJ [Patescibacteria group bacterium]|jgi:putative peptidoglycan lipid II flippase